MSTFPRTIAVIEDDASMLKGLDRLLRTLGFATELYPSAEDYLTRATKSKANCLLLDIHLGGISGIELKRHLVAAGLGLPVIFMTAVDDGEIERDAIETGCVAYLHKPFLSSALVDALNRATS
jgi:FixJ family two-component response regulator